MKLEWVILAEGLGQDSKGAVTAIGLNQNILISPTLPASTKRAVLAHFVEDGTSLSAGQQFTFRISFISPSGKVISAQTGSAPLIVPPWADLPIAIDMPAEMMLNCSEYGTHRIEVSMELPDGDEIKGHVDFYVREKAPPIPQP